MEMQGLLGVSIAHVSRDANNVAHQLAKEASTGAFVIAIS
jgi:hypothetical protein